MKPMAGTLLTLPQIALPHLKTKNPPSLEKECEKFSLVGGRNCDRCGDRRSWVGEVLGTNLRAVQTPRSCGSLRSLLPGSCPPPPCPHCPGPLVEEIELPAKWLGPRR